MSQSTDKLGTTDAAPPAANEAEDVMLGQRRMLAAVASAALLSAAAPAARADGWIASWGSQRRLSDRSADQLSNARLDRGYPRALSE
jgi:hypothetical protein